MQAAAALAAAPLEIVLHEKLAELPHFNPDLDRDPFPAAVADSRAELRNSAGVVISCPEYAHGVPGVLKNALDWLVASGELYEKPVALFNASPVPTPSHLQQFPSRGVYRVVRSKCRFIAAHSPSSPAATKQTLNDGGNSDHA